MSQNQASPTFKEDLPPKVIGFVPAYNSEKFIKRTLSALANQDYPNFEIWICDDASVDKTGEICIEFCRQDIRFKFFRNAINQGWWKTSEQFWNSCSKLSDYCFFNPHDDTPEPDFISNQVNLLEQNPKAVLCVPGIKNTYSNGESNQTIHRNIGTSLLASDRIIPLVNWEIEDWWAAYHGIHRSDYVAKVFPVRPNRFGEKEFALDLIWLIKLASLGMFVCADKVLFEKNYSKKTLSGQWKYNFINRSAVYLAMTEVVFQLPISGVEKLKIFKSILNKALGSIWNKIVSPKKIR
jgi:glycosyltransferase involved in cell wall biosynthesis